MTESPDRRPADGPAPVSNAGGAGTGTAADPDESALYVYAIAPAGVASEVATWHATGVAGCPVRVVASGGLAAVVHRAPAAPYQGPDGRVKEWLLEHAWVVERTWVAAGTVLPVAFNVLVAGGQGADPDSPAQAAEERLRAWLERESAHLLSRLERLRDRVELKVEIGLDPGAGSGGDAAAAAAEAAGAAAKPPGVRRLLEARAAQAARDAAARSADRLYPAVRARLAALADDIVEQRRARLGEGVVPVLVASILVRRDLVDAVGLALAEVRDETPGARVRFLGPWPPYNFAGAEVDPR